MSATKEVNEHEDGRGWRRWLCTFISVVLGLSAATYGAVVLIDPFSTGRFALTQRIDRTISRTSDDVYHWFSKAGIIRDPQFDAIILGSSVAGPLDPVSIGKIAGRNVAQMALYGALPRDTLTVSRAYGQHHAAGRDLRILTLDVHWCNNVMLGNRNRFDWLPNFPAWIYESSNAVYLSKIFSPFAIRTAIARVNIWLGRRNNVIPADGFAPIFPGDDRRPKALARLQSFKPDPGGPRPEEPFPNLDALAAHLDALGPHSPMLLVYLPVFVHALPPEGSIAASRFAACRSNAAAIASRHANVAWLDLTGNNPMSRDVNDYWDEYHFRDATARMVDQATGDAAAGLLSRIGR